MRQIINLYIYLKAKHDNTRFLIQYKKHP